MLQNGIFVIIVAVALTGTLAFSQEINVNSTMGFNQPCDNVENCTDNCKICDNLAYLVCKNNETCACRPGTFRDHVEGLCTSFAEQDCDEYPDLGLPLFCIENAYCHSSKVCKCNSDDGYMHNGEGLCKQGFEGNCATSLDCNRNSFLSCSFSKCLCSDPNNTYWDETKKICIPLVGGSCYNPIGSEDRECTPNAACINGKCECTGDFTEGPDKTCKAGFHVSCQDDDDCGANLVCHETGICTCHENFVANNATKECHIKVDDDCNSVELDCVPNASCGVQNCECNPGFSPIADFTECKASLRQQCREDECNEDENLTCDNPTQGICTCGQGYSVNDTVCVGNIGTSCSRETSGQSDECIPKASCSGTTDLQCICLANHTPSPPGTTSECLLNLDQSCTATGQCNRYNFIECNIPESKCSCEDLNNQKPENAICVSLAGKGCDLAMVNGRQLTCIEGTTCQANEGNPICVCSKEGEVAQSDGTCAVPGGGGSSGASNIKFSLTIITIVSCIFTLV